MPTTIKGLDLLSCTIGGQEVKGINVDGVSVWESVKISYLVAWNVGKLNYVVGETFSDSNFSFRVYYTDGTYGYIFAGDYTYSPQTALTLTDTEVMFTYTYGGVTIEYAHIISVKEPDIWAKYSTLNDYQLIEYPQPGAAYLCPPQIPLCYSSTYTYNDSTGIITLTSYSTITAGDATSLQYVYVIPGGSSGTKMSYVTSITYSVNMYYTGTDFIVETVKSKGTYIEDVSAYPGTYPSDGVSGSYWYVLR